MRPPLPEPQEVVAPHAGITILRYTPSQMQAYADACVAAFRKECRGDDCGELASLKDSHGQLQAEHAKLRAEVKALLPDAQAYRSMGGRPLAHEGETCQANPSR